MTEKQQTPELNVIPAEELPDTTYAPSGTLIDNLMGQGIYIFAGSPKAGKSWLVLRPANQVSKGKPVRGLKAEKCGVLYISLEDIFQRIQQRLNAAPGTCGGKGGKPPEQLCRGYRWRHCLPGQKRICR